MHQEKLRHNAIEPQMSTLALYEGNLGVKKPFTPTILRVLSENDYIRA